MTWAEACESMLSGKRVRRPEWNRWISIGFGHGCSCLTITRLEGGVRQYAPDLRDMSSDAWVIVNER